MDLGDRAWPCATLAANVAARTWPSRPRPPSPAAASGTPDRQDRLPAPARAAGRGPAARVLDPARAGPGSPGAAGGLPRPAPRAHRLGAAHPRGLLPPGAAAGRHRPGHDRLPGGPAARAPARAAGRRPAPGRREKVLAERIYGVGPLTALALACWLGGAGRFSSAREAVRFAGLDITVYSSDGKRAPAACPGRGPRCCAGRSTRPARPTPAPQPLTTAASRSLTFSSFASVAPAACAMGLPLFLR